VDRAGYVEAVRAGIVAQGWGLSRSECADVADELAEIAAHWPVGTVLERRLDVLGRRDLPSELPV
jgi:hypothetical protein